MAAAAARELQRLIGPGWSGSRVLVAVRGQGGAAAVVVTLVDTCGCPGGRVIDLYSSVWDALGQPLSRGVLPVTVEVAP